MDDFTADEKALDQHIRDCSLRMTDAYAAGDRENVDLWRSRMYDAIKSRSPEHQAKIYARIDSAIWFQGDEALAMGRVV